jgi:hypothetical protein
MSADTPTPVELPFGAAYERLQEVAAELSADATMAPERLIALLREGKGLERALRDHLDRLEQEVRAIDDGDGATPFRIVDAAPSARPAALPVAGFEAAPAAPELRGAPEAPAASASVAAPEAPTAPEAPARRRRKPAAPPAEPSPPASPVAPTLGFGDDDDIPF